MLECQGMITKENSEDSYASAFADSGHHFSLADYCYKCWLIVVLMLLECISLEVKKTFKKKKKKEGKIIINPSFRFSVITLQRVCKSWILMISARGFWAISLKRSSICIRSPICQSVYKAIKCALISPFPRFGKVENHTSRRILSIVLGYLLACPCLVSLCPGWKLGQSIHDNKMQDWNLPRLISFVLIFLSSVMPYLLSTEGN